MNYKEFIELVKSALQAHLGAEYELREEIIPKPNDMILNALIINNKQSNLAPCIYMDTFYDSYLKGAITLNDIVEQILEIYRSNSVTKPFDAALFLDFNYTKFKLCGRLINTNKNTTFLEDVPHREFLDLSLVYYADFSAELHSENCFIPIKNSHLKLWNITEEELYEQTIENLNKQDDSLFLNLSELFETVPFLMHKESAEKMQSMYLLTNKNKLYGAIQILNEKNLQSAANLLETDFLLLPSSQHEFLLIPNVSEDTELNDLVDIVKYINATQLLAQEVLSDHVYRYSREDNKISIAI